MKVLIIAYSFPPSGMSGVYRTLGFVKHLPENGWSPIVLTVPEDSYPIKDSSLINDVSRGVSVVRIPYWGAKPQKFFAKKSKYSTKKRPTIINTIIKWLSIPDNMNRWIPNAYFAGKKIIKRENIDLIWSTSPDASTHLIAYLLKRKFGLPWVADFRDPWISSFVDNKSFLWKSLNEFLQSRVLNKADRVVTVSNNLRQNLISRYPKVSPKKFLVITNGFEEGVFKKKYSPTRKFTIIHTGRFYGKRTPLPFLSALKLAFSENPEIERETRVRFIGTLERDIEKEIKKSGMWGKIELIPQVAHKTSIEYQCSSDILLLIPGQDTLTMPGKIFEYLAAKRPILALTDKESDSARLIKETKSGIIVNPSDISQIKEKIKKLFFEYKKGRLNLRIGQSETSNYSRTFLTKRLSRVFGQLIYDKTCK